MTGGVPDFGQFVKQADPNKMLGEILQHSERWNLGQKLAGAIVSFGAAGLVLGVGSPRTVIAAVLALVGISLISVRRRALEAESLVLKDSNGRPRLVLANTPSGPAIVMLDEDGIIRTSLACFSAGATLALLDRSGTNRLAVACVDAVEDGIPAMGVPSIQLMNQDGEQRAGVQVGRAGEGGLELSDGDHTTMASASFVGTTAGDAGPSASIHISEKGAAVDCSSSDAEVGLLATPDVGPLLHLSRGDSGAQVGVAEEGATLAVFKDSTPVAHWHTTELPGGRAEA